MGLSRRVIVLAIAVLALAVWLFGIELPNEKAAIEAIQGARILLPIDPASVDTLRVRRADRPWKVVRDDDGWQIVEPIVERAQDRVVESVLRRLTMSERRRQLSPDLAETSWQNYGLEPEHSSSVELILSSRDGHSVRLLVGSEIPTGDYCYVRREGSSALEIADQELNELANSTHHGFRRRSLFQTSTEKIRVLEGAGQGGPWRAVRDTTTGLWWRGAVGRRPRLMRWELDGVALSVAEETVQAYLRDNLSEADWAGYGLDRPWASMTAIDRRGNERTLWLGNEVGAHEYFGRRSGLETVFIVKPGFVGVLDRGIDAWRDDNPVHGNMRRAIFVEITLDDGSWARIHPRGRQFQLEIADGRVADSDYRKIAARNVMIGLEEMQPKSTMFVPKGAAPASLFVERSARVLIQWERDAMTLEFGWREDDPNAWFTFDGAGELYSVDRGLYLRLRALVDAAINES